MNNPIGMCFPDFIGLRPLGLPFCARPGRKKYRSVARMIFSCPAKPIRAALRQKAGNPRPLPLKSGKTDSFLYGYKRMQTFRLTFSWLFGYRCYSSLEEIIAENIIEHFLNNKMLKLYNNIIVVR